MTSRGIDFARLNEALLQQVDAVLLRWLPHGVERNGRWYVGDFDGGPGESANVNMRTGQWIDNAAPDEDKGGDLISLYARVQGLGNAEAARALMRDMGWLHDEPLDHRPAPVQTPATVARAPEPPTVDAGGSAVAPARAAKRQQKWRAVVPVPAFAPPPTFVFGYRDKQRGDQWVELEAVRTWEYRYEGQLYGHVARFERVASDGELVKDTVARTWCVDESDGRGSQRWHWKQWDAPRPLYVPATVLSADKALPVVLVEGEKCARAGHELLGHEFDFVSWPGGCKAWALAQWAWLAGRVVYLWPDCDAKRQRLSATERQAGADPAGKPLLPEAKQPGMAAMVGIGSLLQAQHGCTVHLCGIPPPGDVVDGWDIADAVAQGWDAARVRDFIRGARSFVSPDDAVRAKTAAAEAAAGAGSDEAAAEHAWRFALLTSSTGAVKEKRENVVLALDGIPGKLLGVPAAAGVVGFNEFTNDVVKLKPAPWGTPVGVWAEVDELLLGEWLVREHALPSMPRGTLEEAVAMVAYRHRYHPVREYLAGLQGRWDGQQRLRAWLLNVCFDAEADVDVQLEAYLQRVGTWFLMGMCQRVLQPGCKFDYMLILEGAQGMRKSTLLATLGGQWFADTGLMLGDKDSYQQLQGKWLYEMGELDAMGRAEITKVKQYIASTSDYFRASFDRRARDYPRQVVFGGTTNEDHYLVDPTGNRRFWPVRVSRVCDIDWLREHRDQLFAEALARLLAGKRMHPTPQEERELFEPQQQLRQVENAIGSAIARWLEEDADGSLCQEITLVGLLGKIGIGVEKLGPGRFHEKQAGAALRRMGWTDHKSSRPGRPIVWRRPQAAPAAAPGAAVSVARGSGCSTGSPQGQVEERAADECPF